MLFKLLLYTHIALGGISLLVGGLVMILKKRTRLHKNLGLIFFYSLLVASLVAFPMCYLHPNLFLFIIAVFTSFMLLSGKRSLVKRTEKDVKGLDWGLTIIMAIFGLLFIVYGIYLFVLGINFGTVLVVFGLFSSLFVRQDIINFSGKSKVKNWGLTTHIQRMVGGYIASFTAFLVVNNTFLPPVIAWLLPSALFVPLLVLWVRKNEIKKKL